MFNGFIRHAIDDASDKIKISKLVQLDPHCKIRQDMAQTPNTGIISACEIEIKCNFKIYKNVLRR